VGKQPATGDAKPAGPAGKPKGKTGLRRHH
jgi:hypothetical protein